MSEHVMTDADTMLNVALDAERAAMKAQTHVGVTPLRPVDRADCCRVQAKVQVEYPRKDGSTTLLFCGHHYDRHQAALAEAGATVLQDIRGTS